MKESAYGKGYLYAHDYPGNFVQQEYLPEALRKTILPSGGNPKEDQFRRFLQERWKGHYNY